MLIATDIACCFGIQSSFVDKYLRKKSMEVILTSSTEWSSKKKAIHRNN